MFWKKYVAAQEMLREGGKSAAIIVDRRWILGERRKKQQKHPSDFGRLAPLSCLLPLSAYEQARADYDNITTVQQSCTPKDTRAKTLKTFAEVYNINIDYENENRLLVGFSRGQNLMRTGCKAYIGAYIMFRAYISFYFA